MTAVVTNPAPGVPTPGESSLPPDDWYDVWDPDRHDELPPMSRVDALEWEEWAGVDQDEAERFMLRLKAPAWVFLPPGAELAAALEELRPQCESPIASLEAMKAAARMESWAAAIKSAAMASFVRQRKAQASEIPRPTQLDSSGRPIDPERSWAAEIAAALHLAPSTASRHIDTALHLTDTLAATHTALRCGALTPSKALAISEATRALPEHAARAVEAHVLRRAPGQTHKNLNASLRRQIAKHTTREDADAHRAAIADRTCKIVPLADGMAGLWVVHTADKIQQMWVVIQAMADLAKRPTPPETPQHNPPTDQASYRYASPGAHPESTTHTSPGEHADPREHVSPTSQACPGEHAGSTTRPCPGKPASLSERTRPGEHAGSTAHTCPGGHAGPTGGACLGEHVDLCQSAGSREHASSLEHAERLAAAEEARSAEPVEPGEPARDGRLAPQRRADAMADLFAHMLHNGLDWLGRRLPDQHRRRPHIEVLTPITTLLGMNDDPCELTGYGPIPAEMARRIATDGTWRRILTDPTNGVVLEASTTRHDPGAPVTETLLARHPVCAWPGCNRTSRECDLDHATPFAKSGRTSLTGMVPYCEYHHVIKDTPAWGWRATAHPDGSVTLTTPTGHRYTTVPPARGPIAHAPTPARTAHPPTLKADPAQTTPPANPQNQPQYTPAQPQPSEPSERQTVAPQPRLFPHRSPSSPKQETTPQPVLGPPPF
ncbi:DUF222 domain-containing protein [Kribbella sp. NPDC004536]|uniref:DUF222 domain-containing protein n=1 Tax=Kribbella sp. NPDC004536 TaxID=3364106 RepID=UPI0036BBC78E